MSESRRSSSAMNIHCHHCSGGAPVWPEIHLHFHAAPPRDQSYDLRDFADLLGGAAEFGIEPEHPHDPASVVQSGGVGYVCARGGIKGLISRVFAKINQASPGPPCAVGPLGDPVALGLTEGTLTPVGLNKYIYCFRRLPNASVSATNYIRIYMVVDVPILGPWIVGCSPDDTSFEGTGSLETDCQSEGSDCV